MADGDWLRIRNWDEWQTYRKDRGQPPWIKVYRRLTSDPNWVSLTDAERGQVVSMWILAADRGGRVPSDPGMIQRLASLENPPDLEVFVRHGFIEGDGNVTTRWRQRDATETETETEKNTYGDSGLVSDLWRVWLDELGGDRPFPRLTATRSKKLKALADEHLDCDDPLGVFRKMLQAVKSSEHHMGNRSYQMPESLFRNEERRDTWFQKATSRRRNGGVPHIRLQSYDRP